MAADLSKVNKKAITSLQAHVRGVLVRSKLTKVKKQFESIVCELDGPEFHVLWNSKILTFPIITNNIEDVKNKLSVGCTNGSKRKEIVTSEDCDEDKTITQEDCDKLLVDGTEIRELRHTGLLIDFDKSIRKNLEEEFDEITVCEETQHTNSKEIKPGSRDNEAQSDNLQSNSRSSSIKSSESIINGHSKPTSPGSIDVDVFTQHSTPVASHLPGMNKNEDLRRHPLLTESWMTDKSFDPVGDDDTNIEPATNTDDLQQRREQVAMEILWTQQAIESRKNYLRLKKDMEPSTNLENPKK